jgi:cytochrome c oxidase cbb3-type subunit 3
MTEPRKTKETDALSGVETTGHEWDGLKELNNPAPRWWLWVFLITIVWAVGYWIAYPSWPTIANHTKGTLGWTEYRQLAASQKDIANRRGAFLSQIHGATLQQVNSDPKLYEFALAGGAAAFQNNCAACHGTGAQGARGYPNLNDDDWLWGGSLDDIYKTIRVGVRSGNPEQRDEQMPAFGRDGLLTPQQVADVSEYVMNLHLGDKAPATPASARGKDLFATNCSSCHGKAGEGNQQMGAPRLSDNIWLYGGDLASIRDQVTNAHMGVMPTWEGRLDDDTIKELTVYVHSLGGGK